MIVFDQQSIRKKIRTVTSMDMGSNAVSNELIILCCTKIGHIAYDILGLITGELYRNLNTIPVNFDEKENGTLPYYDESAKN